MELTGYRCWDPRRVFTVMNPDAEHVSEEQFLAVHTEYPLSLVDPILKNRDSADPKRYSMAPTEFLKRFLDPYRNHVQAVIMGGSGSGKSHFIKWLSLHIQNRTDRRVLVIPKAGMSLRRIVERLIEELSPDMRPRYQVRLNEIGYEMADRPLMRKKLCTHIASALESAEATNALEAYLVEELPNLFFDPELRQILNDRHGVIEDLVDHIFEGPAGYQRLESQRLFYQDDLPLRPKEIGQLAVRTQMLVRQMQNDTEMIQAALLLINRNLSRAISQCLNFTGDQLIDLMLDVRRSLKAEGKSLVLLIEDFARLQGIDGALLQALIEAASPENGLCELRWAMAVTSGYYEQHVPAGVQTRMHFVVDMDVPTGSEDGVTTDKVVAFAGRYLNAVRVSGADLIAWRQAHLDGGQALPVPNRCTECVHRVACHRTFGQIDGFGLYPFSANAVLNMTRRMDAGFEKRFNPRIVVKEVMQEVLGNYGDEILAGAFPSKGLLQRMGGSWLTPAEEQKLRAENLVQADRRLALVSLWSARREQGDSVPDAIFDAFGLMRPSRADRPAVPVTPSGGEEIGVALDIEKGKSPTDVLVAGIQEWGRGRSMQDQVLNALRPHLRKALYAYVDWDRIGTQPPGDFEPRSIGFIGQMTKFTPPAKGPRLLVPLDPGSEDERRHSAMALEGLLRYMEHRNWDFPNGTMLMAAYAEAVDRWAAELVRQIRDLPGGTSWDPVAAAVELLTIANAMTGLPATKDATLVDWVEALFHIGRVPDESLAPTWRSVAQELLEQRPLLQEMVRSRVSGTKGGRRGAFIDPTVVCEAVRRVRRSWIVAEKIPLAEVEGRGVPFKNLAKARKRVDKDLVAAVQREAERRRDLVETVSDALPNGYGWKEFVGDLVKLVDQVDNVGVAHTKALHDQMRGLLTGAEKLAVADALREILALDEKERTNLAVLGRAKTSQVLEHASQLVRTADKYLVDVTTGIEKDSEALGELGDLLDRSKETIARRMATLADELKELGGVQDA